MGVHTNEYFSTGWSSDRSTQLQTGATTEKVEKKEEGSIQHTVRLIQCRLKLFSTAILSYTSHHAKGRASVSLCPSKLHRLSQRPCPSSITLSSFLCNLWPADGAKLRG